MIPNEKLIDQLSQEITFIISETNGISLSDTLELLLYSKRITENHAILKMVQEFKGLLASFQEDNLEIPILLRHPFSKAFFKFFKNFPLKYHEEHIHLTGSLSAEFIYPKLEALLQSKYGPSIRQKIESIYGKNVSLQSCEDVDQIIRVKEGDLFNTYLKILYLPKMVLISREANAQAAYHMAHELYFHYNVGKIRLKFTFSRASNMEGEEIPGLENITEEDAVLGLYEGFMAFKKKHPDFDFILSPSFRKELDFYDKANFKSKKDHFTAQVNKIVDLLQKHPYLIDHFNEIDTIGDERELYRKAHFKELKEGLRKLQYIGFKIRSHHGETWNTLRKGIQSVDNAMNIWHIDALEHGLSLGINPNFYFHRVYQRVMSINRESKPIVNHSMDFQELMDMDWPYPNVQEKLLKGIPLNEQEEILFLKTKFHQAREIEHYQHDVLNRVIDKNLTVVALPSSNLKLTGMVPDYKDHPFSWWEKKGVDLGVGTDNYITLNTNYIEELLILLYSDPKNLKITKLLMVASKEHRRPYISHLLWQMRKQFI